MGALPRRSESRRHPAREPRSAPRRPRRGLQDDSSHDCLAAAGGALHVAAPRTVDILDGVVPQPLDCELALASPPGEFRQVDEGPRLHACRRSRSRRARGRSTLGGSRDPPCGYKPLLVRHADQLANRVTRGARSVTQEGRWSGAVMGSPRSGRRARRRSTPRARPARAGVDRARSYHRQSHPVAPAADAVLDLVAVAVRAPAALGRRERLATRGTGQAGGRGRSWLLVRRVEFPQDGLQGLHSRVRVGPR